MARTHVNTTVLVAESGENTVFTGFRSRHDVRFFEKRVNTNIFWVHQNKKSVQQVQTIL